MIGERNERKKFLLNIPSDKLGRMKKAMKAERQTNTTAFILNAIESMCDGQERESNLAKLEKTLSILVENAAVDRERAARRHAETMIWLDALAQAVCTDDDEYQDFRKEVQTSITNLRGT